MEGDKFLPNIMLLCDETERNNLVKHSKKFIKDNRWIGGLSGNCKNRPTLKYPTREAKRRKLGKNRSSFLVSHIILIEHGQYPEEDDTASHLCHNACCIDINHLIWERGDFNQRRKRCQKLKKCICRLEKKCIINAHLP